MKAIWTQTIKDPDQKTAYVSGLKHDIYIKQLRDILEDKERELVTSLISPPKDSVWPYAQAHLDGRLYDLRAILDLLNFDQ